MAQVNSDFYGIALYEFKRKYSHQWLIINNPQNIPKPFFGKIIHDKNVDDMFIFNETLQNVLIKDYELTLNTLKYFGCVIERFDMTVNRLDDKMRKTIFQHLTKYSARSLIEFKVANIKVKWLDELVDPFPRLIEFTYIDNLQRALNLLPGKLVISKKFPNLRRLKFLNWIGDRDEIFPIEYFPHLEYVCILFNEKLTKKNRINKFLKQNSHIRHVEVIGFPADYIVKIHAFVPNVEKLTIGNVRGYDSIDIAKPIHFENLKSLHVLCQKVKSLEKISFSNLQDLRIFFNPNSLIQWEQFFQRNHTFTHFEINQPYSSSSDWTTQIDNQLDGLPPSVVEITLNSAGYHINRENILHILERRENLIKLTCKSYTFIEDVNLGIELERTWNITTPDDLYHGWKGLQFTRKN